MQIDTATDPYVEEVGRAKDVYANLLQELRSAKTIYVGGITGPGGGYVLGETSFLCSQFPDLVFVDDWKAGTSVYGREVISVPELAQRCGKGDILINNTQSAAGWNHFRRQADSLGIRWCSSLEVLSVLYKSGVPMKFWGLFSVYGPAFHEHALNNAEMYRGYRSVFHDQLSVRTFDDLLRYRLTGDPTFLNRVAVGHNYGTARPDSYMMNSQFFSFSDDEVFIDAGALSGDSTEYFIRSVGGNFKRIVLFEPNPDSIQQCEDRIANLDREFVGKSIAKKCDLVKKGLFGFTGELSFSTSLYDNDITIASGVMPASAHIIDTGMSAPFVAPGEQFGVMKIPVTTLDEVMGDDPATFIKFEIEGSEVDALHGAAKTIRRNRPKMALSIYHRPQDLELIIDYVRDLDMGYKMALRAHNPNVPDAVVLYCWAD